MKARAAPSRLFSTIAACGTWQGRGAGKPKLFHQPVLQGLVRPFDPALRLARIGADDVDVQRVERAAELGHAVAADGALMVDAKDAVLSL
jgi:hypothetical protein